VLIHDYPQPPTVYVALSPFPEAQMVLASEAAHMKTLDISEPGSDTIVNSSPDQVLRALNQHIEHVE